MILELGNNGPRYFSGMLRLQLEYFFTLIWFPERILYGGYYECLGEEIFLHYICCNRCGDEKLRMSSN